MSEVVLSAEERRAFGALVARAWGDEEFAARYGSEPQAVLAEYGIVAEAAPELPAAPVEEITDEALTLSTVGGLKWHVTCGDHCIGSMSCPVGTIGSCEGGVGSG